MKKILSIISLAALTIGLLGSCKKEDPKVFVTGVTLEPTTLETTVGDDVKLTAAVVPENATDKTVSWASEKAEVASVDNEGNVHAIAAGSATITVTTTDGGKTATCVVTVKAALPAGALPGEFSVNADGKKVHFSQGNLYYDGSKFNFEANQYNSTPSADGSWSTDHISHFYWSKDASVAYAETYSDGSATNSDVFFTNAEEETAKADFTVNGVTGKYRTLFKEEWRYLINMYGYENIRKGKYKCGVTVCEKANCLILVPDECLNGYSFDNTKTSYSVGEWATAEAAGLVCLPATGLRRGSSVSIVGDAGYYWSSASDVENIAYFVGLTSDNVYSVLNDSRGNGISVRLITVVE